MKKNKLFSLALIAAMALFSACSNDSEDWLQEDVIRLTSEIIPSRVASLNYQSTQIVAGQKVGVTIVGAKEAHNNQSWTAGNDGELTPASTLYWGATDVTVYAYHPYHSDWSGESYTFSVKPNQHTEADYLSSDLLWTQKTASKTADPIALTFNHMLSKVSVKLVSDDIADLSGATISVCGTKTSATFNTKTGTLAAAGTVGDIVVGVTAQSPYTAAAIIVPQTVSAGTPFVQVALGNKNYFYTLPSEKTFKSGHSYTYELKVTSNKLIHVSGTITDWNDEDLQGAVTEIVSTYANGVAHLVRAGELSQVIPASEKNTLTSLKITGYLNSDDVRFIREMSGSTHDCQTARLEGNPGSLKSLDISECTVVPGGTYFYKEFDGTEYVTAENDLGWHAFTCTRLQDVSLPVTLTKLGYNILAYTAIKEIVIPESVVDFGGGYVFEGSTVEKVHLPKHLKFGVEGSLSCCSKLHTITITEGNTDFFLEDDGLLYVNTFDANGNPTVALYCCPGSYTSATISPYATILLYSSMGGCQFQSIEIHEAITRIHWNTFRNCENLRQIKCWSQTPPVAHEITQDGSGTVLTPFMNNNAILAGLCTLWVPKGSEDAYGNSPGWSIFKEKNQLDYYSN